MAMITTSSLLKCSVQATIEELIAFNVTHYSFHESSEGFCKIYTSYDDIGNANASIPEASLVWFLKVPDNVTYGESCDKQDTEGLIKCVKITSGNGSGPGVAGEDHDAIHTKDHQTYDDQDHQARHAQDDKTYHTADHEAHHTEDHQTHNA
ncbi:hypothetical protein AAVH_17038 [Aphelenchoides avenae]|nr:hypothetical protein AAVH_17038 [Aphelenchus avenae]